MHREFLSSEYCYPNAFEVIKHPNYQGLNTNIHSFLSFTKDSLYRFPMIDTLNIQSEPKTQITSELVTFTQAINISQTIQQIHGLSPFKKTLNCPEIIKNQMSHEAPMNSMVTSTEDQNILTTSKGDSTTGRLEIPEYQRRSLTPNSETSIPNMNSFEINAIKDIHLKYISKRNDSLYRSITPDNSYISESPGERRTASKILENEINFSRISSSHEDLTENWGSMIFPRLSDFDEKCCNPSIVFEPTRSIDYTDDYLSFMDEGTAQQVRDFIPIESTASKNLLMNSKFQ